MTRNTKIALGCGGGGCLGLILLVILFAVLVVAGVIKAPGLYNPDRRANNNYNYNRNSTSNRNSDANENSNSTSSSASMTDDAKHRLFQAAGATKDNQIMLRMLDKIGYPQGQGDGYSEFIKDHFAWALKNVEFMQTINTPEKARAYFDAHIDD